jgi:excisionase family DNA binding protein
MAKEYLTVQQLSEFIHLSRHTIYKYVEWRKIPHIKRGRLLQFDKDDIVAWQEAAKIKSVYEYKRP